MSSLNNRVSKDSYLIKTSLYWKEVMVLFKGTKIGKGVFLKFLSTHLSGMQIVHYHV